MKYIKDLLAEIENLKGAFEEAVKQLDENSLRNEKQAERIKELEDLINKQKEKPVQKTSRNSNLPPSKDLDRSKRSISLREKSGKKVEVN